MLCLTAWLPPGKGVIVFWVSLSTGWPAGDSTFLPVPRLHSTVKLGSWLLPARVTSRTDGTWVFIFYLGSRP